MSRPGIITSSIALVLSAGLLVACGGGGGGGGSAIRTPAPAPTPTPTPTPTSSWQQGVFSPASQFKNRCQMPRTGTDIEGNRFPDQQGTLLQELNWLRSWTHETYLWNDEVVDQNPAGFTSTASYFDVLKTTETTASGNDKDNFHFSQPTEDYLRDRSSAPRSGYGVSFAILAASVPRDVRVRYTEPNSPASNTNGGEAPFQRGARILRVDGVDVINASSSADIATLNAGLFPASSGETHTFVVQDVGEASRTVSVTSADVVMSPVNKTNIIEQNGQKIGYILFNTFSPFSSEEAIANAITEMDTAGVSDLVLDLRYNGGGLLAVASQLSYMIAGPGPTNGAFFEQTRFNDDAGNRNPVTGELNDPMPFYKTGLGFSLANGVPLDTLNLNRVFILSSGRTCSASESVINGLRGVDVEVILIGNITCGKPYGFYPTDNCGTTWYTIQFQGVNNKNFGDYADGFVPDDNSFAFGARTPGCTVADDYTKPLGDPTEALFATALSYRETGSCPAIAAVAENTTGESAQSAALPGRLGEIVDEDTARRSELDAYLHGRDLRMPNSKRP